MQRQLDTEYILISLQLWITADCRFNIRIHVSRLTKADGRPKVVHTQLTAVGQLGSWWSQTSAGVCGALVSPAGLEVITKCEFTTVYTLNPLGVLDLLFHQAQISEEKGVSSETMRLAQRGINDHIAQMLL